MLYCVILAICTLLRSRPPSRDAPTVASRWNVNLLRIIDIIDIIDNQEQLCSGASLVVTCSAVNYFFIYRIYFAARGFQERLAQVD